MEGVVLDPVRVTPSGNEGEVRVGGVWGGDDVQDVLGIMPGTCRLKDLEGRRGEVAVVPWSGWDSHTGSDPMARLDGGVGHLPVVTWGGLDWTGRLERLVQGSGPGSKTRGCLREGCLLAVHPG